MYYGGIFVALMLEGHVHDRAYLWIVSLYKRGGIGRGRCSQLDSGRSPETYCSSALEKEFLCVLLLSICVGKTNGHAQAHTQREREGERESLCCKLVNKIICETVMLPRFLLAKNNGECGILRSQENHNIKIFVFLFQIHHTFATAGSDGAFNFWDKDSKQRLKVWILIVYIALIF